MQTWWDGGVRASGPRSVSSLGARLVLAVFSWTVCGTLLCSHVSTVRVSSSYAKTGARTGDEVLVSHFLSLLDCSGAVQCCWTSIAARINDSIGRQKAARFFSV